MTLPPTPPLSPRETPSLINTTADVSNSAATPPMTTPETPVLGPTEGSKLTLGTGTFLLSGDPENALTKALGATPEGRQALLDGQRYKVNLLAVPGTGSSYDPQSNTVTLGADLPFEQKQAKYIHEMTHVWYAKNSQTGDPIEDDLGVYVEKMLGEEAEAESRAIWHSLRLNPRESLTALEREYVSWYEEGVSELRREWPTATQEQLHEAGLLGAKERLVETFRSGGVVPSTSGNDEEEYEEYYKKEWFAARKALSSGKPLPSNVRPAPNLMRLLRNAFGSDSKENTFQEGQSLLKNLEPILATLSEAKKYCRFSRTKRLMSSLVN